MEFSKESLLPFISFKTSRSGGKGGQHVNKVSSKVELNFNFEAVSFLTEIQKDIIRHKLSNKFSNTGQIQIITEKDRSQLRNKDRSIEKLFDLLKLATHQPKIRKATIPKKSVTENRLLEKQKQAVKKIFRRKNFLD